MSTTAKAAKTTAPSLSQMADELGALEKEYDLALAPFEHKLPRMKALREALQLACKAKPDAEWIVEGARFGVRLGPRAMARFIDLRKLFKRMGAAPFIAFVTSVFVKYQSCGVSSLEDAEADPLVTSVQTGPRKLSTFEKGAAA